jgi:hypothetical protein
MLAILPIYATCNKKTNLFFSQEAKEKKLMCIVCLLWNTGILGLGHLHFDDNDLIQPFQGYYLHVSCFQLKKRSYC